jgi:hypothetical protein
MVPAALMEKILLMCTAGDCPGPAIGICLARSEGPVQRHWGRPAGYIVMGQDGPSKGWGTLNFETETDAERAIQVIPYHTLQTTGNQCLPIPFTFPFPCPCIAYGNLNTPC